MNRKTALKFVIVAAAFCGLTASTTADGVKSRGISAASATTVMSGPANAMADGDGSTANDGERPCSRQPASMALPMRPQPTSKIGGIRPGATLMPRTGREN